MKHRAVDGDRARVRVDLHRHLDVHGGELREDGWEILLRVGADGGHRDAECRLHRHPGKQRLHARIRVHDRLGLPRARCARERRAEDRLGLTGLAVGHLCHAFHCGFVARAGRLRRRTPAGLCASGGDNEDENDQSSKVGAHGRCICTQYANILKNSSLRNRGGQRNKRSTARRRGANGFLIVIFGRREMFSHRSLATQDLERVFSPSGALRLRRRRSRSTRFSRTELLRAQACRTVGVDDRRRPSKRASSASA